MMQGMMSEMSGEMMRCIERCRACHETCESTMMHCLKMGGKHVEADHLRLMMDCEQICGVSVDFVLRMSPHAKHVCRECAEICRQCAEDCERLGDEHMKKCAATCRACAETCSKMAN